MRMASPRTWVNVSVLLVALLVLDAVVAEGYKPRPAGTPKPLKIRVFVTLHIDGPNGTEVTVASRAPGQFGFGSVIVVDDPIFKGQSTSSLQLGRVKGIGANTDRANNTNHTSLFLTFLFNYNKLVGGIQVHGTSIKSNTVRTFSIVGGTEDFLLARGLATQRTVAQGPDPANPNAFFQTNEWIFTIYPDVFGPNLPSLKKKASDLVIE